MEEHLGQPVARPKELGVVNEWILHQVSHTAQQYKKQFEVHEFHHALSSVESFFWADFCDNYLEVIKDQFFNPTAYSQQQLQATRWTLQTVGCYILQMFAPFLPHIIESLYQLIFKQHHDVDSIHRLRFSDAMYTYDFSDAVDTMKIILALINDVRKLKTNKELSLKTDLEELLVIVADPKIKDLIVLHEQLIKGIVRTKKITFGSGTQVSALEVKNDLWYAVVSVGN